MVDLLRQFSVCMFTKRYTSQVWHCILTLLFINVQVLKQSAVDYLNGSDYASQVDDCTFIQL